jgi:hypothetical protein
MKKFRPTLRRHEEELFSEDRLYYIKQGLRNNVVGIYELGWKSSCDFIDINIKSIKEISKELKELYNFDEDKVFKFIKENIK